MNAYFRASVETIDASGNIVIDIESDVLALEVRGDRLFLESHLGDDEGVRLGNTLRANDTPNISLFDLNIDTLPESPNGDIEELFIGIKNNTRAGNTLEINYPIEISLEREGELVYSESDVSREQLE